ncbi:MAG: glycosyltransferase [Candidatus Tyrphobacter sp.]
MPPGAVHVCYVNAVSRFLSAYDAYVGGFGFGYVARPFVRRLAAWDRVAAMRPTILVANSRNVAERIAVQYGRDALVLHCPVDLARFSPGTGAGNYFIVASRLLPYKRIEIAVAAAQIANVPLVVAGSGPAQRRLRALANGTTTTMLGYVDDARLNELMGNARAAIVPGEEDFGLVPLEAAAAGRPAIALRAGGALETIDEGVTGEFFDEPTAQSLAAVLARFDASRYDARRLRAHAERFSPEVFVAELRKIVARVRSSS